MARTKVESSDLDHKAQRRDVLDMASRALDRADQKLSEGSAKDFDALKNAGIALADLALAFTPGVGWAKDVYEAVSGRVFC